MSVPDVRYEKEIGTVDTIADILKAPKSTIYAAARENPPRIGGVIRFGRLLRFDMERFYAWLDAGGEALPGRWRQEQQEAA